jgi:LEA14-like dessication related protein
MMSMRRLGLAMVVICLTACSTFAPRLDPPQVKIASLRMIAVTAADVAVTIVLDLDNTNTRDLHIDALDFSVNVAGAAVASGHTDQPVLLPASGSGQASVTAHADFANWSLAVSRLIGKPTFDYEISGVAHIDGRTLPFSRHGEMKTNGILGRP